MLAKPDPLTIIIPAAQRKLQMTRHLTSRSVVLRRVIQRLNKVTMQYPFYSMDHIPRVLTRVNPADRERKVEDWYQKATPFL